MTTANRGSSGADASKFNNATSLTITDDAGSVGSSLDLDNATTTTLTAVTVTGDAGADVVQLSTALTSSNKVTIDFASDAAGAAVDKLIFNTADTSNWITYDSDGSTATGSPTAFTFNKFSNFDLASGEDQFGIFYDNSNAIGAFQEISSTTAAAAYRLRDGVVYEDTFNSDGDILSSAALSAATIRSNIGFIINERGSGTATSTGSSGLDFTYVMYARSSSTEDADSVQSAYVYAANYSGEGISNNSFDATKLKVVGIAEIVGVTEGDLQDAFITSKPAGF